MIQNEIKKKKKKDSLYKHPSIPKGYQYVINI